MLPARFFVFKRNNMYMLPPPSGENGQAGTLCSQFSSFRCSRKQLELHTTKARREGRATVVNFVFLPFFGGHRPSLFCVVVSHTHVSTATMSA